MANQNNQQNTVEIKSPELEKAVKSIARCNKIVTAITVGLTAAAVGLYVGAALAIKKMANS